VWHVHGRRSAWLLDRDGRHEVPSGSSATLDRPPTP